MYITDEPHPQNYVALAIILVFLAAVIVFFVYQIVRRFTLNSNKQVKSVTAVFVCYRQSVLNPSASDRARMAKENTNIAFENHVLVFQEKASGKELRFSLPRTFKNTMMEGQEGVLTYSGSRFIRFDV